MNGPWSVVMGLEGGGTLEQYFPTRLMAEWFLVLVAGEAHGRGELADARWAMLSQVVETPRPMMWTN